MRARLEELDAEGDRASSDGGPRRRSMKTIEQETSDDSELESDEEFAGAVHAATRSIPRPGSSRRTSLS